MPTATHPRGISVNRDLSQEGGGSQFDLWADPQVHPGIGSRAMVEPTTSTTPRANAPALVLPATPPRCPRFLQIGSRKSPRCLLPPPGCTGTRWRMPLLQGYDTNVQSASTNHGRVQCRSSQHQFGGLVELSRVIGQPPKTTCPPQINASS